MRLIALGLLATVAFSATALAAPAMVVSPVVGHPKIPTTVSGTGFTANEAVDVYFGPTDEFLAVTNSTGAFAGQELDIPKDAPPGSHWITAVGRKTGDAAQQLFTVRTDWTTFAFDAQHGGRNPYENVIDSSNVGTLRGAWSYATGGSIYGSPIVFANVIFFGSLDHKLYALTTKGTVKWTATVSGAIQSTPGYARQTVYVGADDNKVYAFDSQTGALKWSIATGGAVISSPVVLGNTLYIGSQDGKVYALNATTGATIWSTATGGPIQNSVPTIVNGVVYIGSSDDSLYALNASTGAILWTVPTGGSILGSATVANGIAYFTSLDDKVYAVNARTGSLLWTYTTGGMSNTTPSVVNGTVFTGSFDNYVYALDASSGALKWSTKLEAQISASSVSLANGVGYIGCVCGRVYGLDLRTGERLWVAETQSNVYGNPAAVNGVLYVTSMDGSLYAYVLNAGNNAAYKPRLPPSYASLHPDHRLTPRK